MSDFPAGTRLAPELGVARLPQLTFGEVDEHGVEWVLSELSGWDSPATTGDSTARYQGHGAYAGAWYYAPRTITLSGRIGADDRRSWALAKDRLFAAVGTDDRIFEVDEGSLPPRQTAVRQNGEIVLEPVNAFVSDFVVPLIALDPFRYSTTERYTATGLPQTTGGLQVPFQVPFQVPSTLDTGVLTLGNAGTVEAWPRWRITGPVTNPRFTPGGDSERAWWLEATLRANEQVTVLPLSGEVIFNGSSRTEWLRGEPEPLWPGSTDVTFTADSAFDPNARVEVWFRDAWK